MIINNVKRSNSYVHAKQSLILRENASVPYKVVNQISTVTSFVYAPLPHILIIHAKCEICLVKKLIINVFDLAIKGQGQSDLILGEYY